MKLYHHDGVWQLPGKQDKRATKVEVPTASEGLCDFLNDRNVPAFPVFEAESVASGAETDHLNEEEFTSFVEAKPTYVDTHNAYKQAERQTQFKTDEIVDFIFDVASVNQVSQIHGAIGTRFAEHLQGTRK